MQKTYGDMYKDVTASSMSSSSTNTPPVLVIKMCTHMSSNPKCPFQPPPPPAHHTPFGTSFAQHPQQDAFSSPGTPTMRPPRTTAAPTTRWMQGGGQRCVGFAPPAFPTLVPGNARSRAGRRALGGLAGTTACRCRLLLAAGRVYPSLGVVGSSTRTVWVHDHVQL